MIFAALIVTKPSDGHAWMLSKSPSIMTYISKGMRQITTICNTVTLAGTLVGRSSLLFAWQLRLHKQLAPWTWSNHRWWQEVVKP